MGKINRLFKTNPVDEYDAMNVELIRLKLILDSVDKDRVRYGTRFKKLKNRFDELMSRKDLYALLRKFQNN